VELVQEGQSVSAILFALALVLFVSWFIFRAGFFRLPPKTIPPHILGQTIGVFLVYIFLAVLAFPILNKLFSQFVKKYPGQLSNNFTGWVQLIGLFVIFGSLVLYCTLIKKEVSRTIFWGQGERTWKRFFKTFGFGVLTCVISYPFVLFVSLLSSLIAFSIWGEGQFEQIAVEQLKLTFGHPFLFALMIFSIVVLVPFMEELLFRGFFQTLLKRYFGRVWAIILSAAVFALVHYASAQGTGNFQLILSLIVLSLFIGFIYEREGTLWAPIALHMTFNGCSVALIALQN